MKMYHAKLNPAFVFCSRVCGRKRKGTPVKVCDRAYVTEDEEEESMSEHSYSPGIYRNTRIFCHLLFVFVSNLVILKKE